MTPKRGPARDGTTGAAQARANAADRTAHRGRHGPKGQAPKRSREGDENPRGYNKQGLTGQAPQKPARSGYKKQGPEREGGGGFVVVRKPLKTKGPGKAGGGRTGKK